VETWFNFGAATVLLEHCRGYGPDNCGKVVQFWSWDSVVSTVTRIWAGQLRKRGSILELGQCC
jgi:hypothetical protein